jgi:putative inorganic carbon (hco3(-)) transporter
MFPPRAPFFPCVRSDARAAAIAAGVGEHTRGNLPVSPFLFHRAAAAARELAVVRVRCEDEHTVPGADHAAFPITAPVVFVPMPHGDLAQAAAVVGAGSSVLVLVPRRRVALIAGFVVLTLAEGMLAVALIPSSDLERLVHRPVLLAGLVLAALIVVGLAALLVRRPALIPLVLLIAAPFRISLTLGSQHAFLLLPFYGVLAAATLAFCWRLVRAEPRNVTWWLAGPVAAFIALSAISLLWSRDLQQGSIELVFFLFPFAALFAIVARAPFPAWLPRVLGTTLVGLTVVFALIGLYQRATHTLFYAPSLEVENTFTSYFRVSSVFKDPSLFGRYLALGIAVVTAAYLLGRVRLGIALAVVAIEYAALWFSYSQSSMVTIFVVVTGLSLVVGSPTTRRVVLAVAGAMVLAAAGAVAIHARKDSARKFTSDRSRLIAVTWKVFRNHPLAGVGVGAQPKASRDEAAHRVEATRNKSHTTPLTVAAELGVIGILVYLVFLAGVARSFLSLAARSRALAIGLAAVFLTLLVHSLFYAGFFEDPITWGVLALAAAALAVYRECEETGDGGGTAEQIVTLAASPVDRPTRLAVDRVES